MTRPGALEGIRVIDLTTNVLGPLATQLLGDAGADVIKVESRQGDPTRSIGPGHTPGMGAYFLNLNRNKRSVVLDLKQPDGHRALLGLIDTADVFVHNMRVAAVARLGLDYAALRPRRPVIIHAGATGFRPDSQLADRPAFDDTIQGMSGIAALNGGIAGPPRFVPGVIADKICGHALASAIVLALFHRERTGEGQEVHLAMLETTAAFTLIEHMWGATVGAPGLGYPRMLTPHRRPYPTADGFLCVIANTDDQWQRLLPALGRPELVHDPRFASLDQRSIHIDAVYGVVAEIMPTRTTAAWLAILDAADIPNGPVAGIADLLDDAYLRDGGFFHTLAHPTGAMTLLAPATTYSATPATIRRAPPQLGEHTAELMAEIELAGR